MRLSVIVTSYNTKDLTVQCLDSFYAQPSSADHELIVIDNASSDGSADAIAARFPRARLIRSAANLGFAAANNLAARQASGEFLLLLNPDTIVLDDAVRKLLDFAAAHPEYGIFGGKTLYPDRRLNPTASFDDSTAWSLFCKGTGLSSAFRRSRLFNPEDLDWWGWDEVREVGVVTGCFLLMKKAHWDELGGFDPDFFMYGEDADLCGRCRAVIGKPCVVYPEATIVHYGGASERVRSDKMVKLFRAKAQTYKRPYSRVPFWYGTLMLDLWAWTRMATLRAASAALASKAESYRSWRDIWRRRGEWRAA